MKSYLIIFILATLIVCASAKRKQNEILSKIKTDVKYISPKPNPNDIYSIEITKTSTSNESQQNKCEVESKKVYVKDELEKFRLTFNQDRKQSVYEKLTTITDKQTAIETFQIIGDYVFVLISNGTAYFLKDDNNFSKDPIKVQTNLTLQEKFNKNFAIIQEYDGKAVVATRRQVVICQPDLDTCEKMGVIEELQYLIKFNILQKYGKYYFLFVSGYSFIVYELGSDNRLFNRQQYNSSHFGFSKLFITQIFPTDTQSIFLLDFYQGIIKLTHDENNLNSIHKNYTYVYKQYGCRNMKSLKGGSYLILHCTLNHKSYFILQLIKNQNYGTYEPQQPIFEDQILMDIAANEKIIMAQTYSGVKLYWSSPNIQNPYPYDHHFAGSIFLHNAMKAKIQVRDSRSQIYISTQDELRIYQLSEKNPDVLCYSLVPITEQYKLNYKYRCENRTQLNTICSIEKELTFESWEHKEVKVKTMLVPFISSVVLIIGIIIFIFKIRIKYRNDVEKATLKYSAGNEFQIESNR